jgi:hypothetical protein
MNPNEVSRIGLAFARVMAAKAWSDVMVGSNTTSIVPVASGGNVDARINAAITKSQTAITLANKMSAKR